jgi:hypothetical protein
MSLKIVHKNSSSSGTPPASGDIDVGELAINAADAELYTKDLNGNIHKFQNTTTGTAGGVKFTQAGAGAVQRTVDSKLKDVVSVKDYGAVGDGVTDDTAAIQAAIDVGQSQKKSTYFPDGNYLVAGSLTIYDGTNLVGSGRSTAGSTTEVFTGTKLIFTGTAAACIKTTNVGTLSKFIVIRDLVVFVSGQYDWIFDVLSPVGFELINVIGFNSWTSGGVLKSGTVGDGATIPSWINRLINCFFTVSDTSTQYVVDIFWTDSAISDCYFTGGKGFVDRGYGGNRYVNTQFDRTNASGAGLTLIKRPESIAGSPDKEVSIAGCYFDVHTTAGILLDSSGRSGNQLFRVAIVGCTFRSALGTDIKLLGEAGYTSSGVSVIGCQMSGAVTTSIDIVGLWRSINIAGNNGLKLTDSVLNADREQIFSTGGFERGRQNAAGYTKLSNVGTYRNVGGFHHELRQSAADNPATFIDCTNTSYASEQLVAVVNRAGATNYSFYVAYSDNLADTEFRLRGDGEAFADGAWTGGGADYAEYFEWSDRNPDTDDRRGIAVVLDGDKIRPAEAGEDPIGVISGNPSVVGDGAWNKWSGKYLRDDYGTYIQEDYEVEDEDGNTVIQQRRKLNPAYDPDVEYTSREERPEWDCVGLMGKLRIRKGQPVRANWIKMRDVSDEVEEWFIR